MPFNYELNQGMLVAHDWNALSAIVKDRKTEKVLADSAASAGATLADDILELAAWAPFHRPAHESHRTDREQSAIMPWRFYVLDAANCRALREHLLGQDQSNIIKMLATADCLVQATWLPNPASEQSETLFEGNLENMEHLAAASAAVQNLLLSATAKGIRNYWSSGGILRSESIFNLLGIPSNEILLGSLFFFPQDVGEATIATSKLRDQRGELNGWVRRVSLVSATS